ncbi:uncharacterized protein LOC142617826 [Castanea sativa]|uniref:uncharacterized protein LOC142617826 n=1 Tax=Castanea sativa TaxID=21020 RepID=UPI003F649DCC
MVWAGTSSGKFSVRSAYNSIMEATWRGTRVESLDGSTMKQVWKSIRSTKTPNKVRNFAWKAGQDILATKENLKKRHVTHDDICNDCGKEIETSSHLFWFCEKAKEVWSHSKLGLPFQTRSTWSFVDIVWQLEYSAANEVAQPLNPSVAVKWHPPDPPKFKMNVDGAVFKDQRATSMGRVMRDTEGKVLAAMSKEITSTPSSAGSRGKVNGSGGCVRMGDGLQRSNLRNRLTHP